MAISRVKTWSNGEVLTHTDLNAEYDNILNNALSLISPLTANLAAGNFSITGLNLGSVSSPALQFNGDANTGIYSSAANTVNIATDGVQAASLGASFVLRAAPEDARTTTVDVAGIIESTTSGAPAAGIGTGLQFNAESGDENPCPFGRLDFAATDVGAGTEDTYLDVLLRVAGVALEPKYRFASTAATGFQGTFTHAATADRTWTLPDGTGTLGLANSTIASLGVDRTTTSSTFASVTGAAVSLTTLKASSSILFMWTGPIHASTNVINLRLNLDAGTVTSTLAHGAVNANIPSSIVYLFTGLAAGSHTIQLEFSNGDNGTLVAINSATIAAGVLIAVEL